MTNTHLSYKCCLCFFSLFLFLLDSGKYAWGQNVIQPIEIPTTWNPVGSGARALGMGGAFIAVADDATAASWNPGGLIQLETPEISVVGEYFSRRDKNSFGTNPEASNRQRVTKENLNYFSASYPFRFLSHNMIISVNYQNLYDFDLDSDFLLSQREIISDGFMTTTWDVNRNINILNEGDIGAVGLAYGIRLTPQFSLGLSLNFWQDWLQNNCWEEHYSEETSGSYRLDFGPVPVSEGPITNSIRRKYKYEFSGFNANLGLLWRINNMLTFGAVVKTPFEADLDFQQTYYSRLVLTGTESVINSTSSEKQKLKMPMSYGIGLSYRFSDAFTVSTDLYRTEWQDFILTRADGSKISPITGLSEEESDIDATTQVRIGAEYLFIKPKYVIPLRAGIFYDPAPAMGSPDNFYGVSLGSGIKLGRYLFDVAYQYRWGNDVGSSLYRNFDFSRDVREHKIYTSLIVHF